MKPKFIIYNPHYSFFGNSLWNIITKKTTSDKITFVKEILHYKNVYVYIDEKYNNSSIDIINRIFLKPIRGKLINFELKLWCKFNKIDYSLIKIIRKSNEITEDDVIFITQHHLNEDNSLKSNNAYKLIHASHYFYNASSKLNIIRELQKVYFIAESNLSQKSAFFKSLYNDKYETYILPFQFKERFKNINSWDARDEKCLALGTTHDLDYCSETKDYIDFFNVKTWHYNREELYQNRHELKDIMNIKIERYDEGLKTKKNKYLNYLQNILRLGRQKKYFSFDIVEEYNKHKIFIAPEERAFLPSINFIEGMACGCAYIGIESEIYRDLGLISGKHYVGYNGSMDDLIEKLKYYKINDDELKNISIQGFEFVMKNFNKETIKIKFISDINSFMKTNMLSSSFEY